MSTMDMEDMSLWPIDEMAYAFRNPLMEMDDPDPTHNYIYPDRDDDAQTPPLSVSLADPLPPQPDQEVPRITDDDDDDGGEYIDVSTEHSHSPSPDPNCLTNTRPSFIIVVPKMIQQRVNHKGVSKQRHDHQKGAGVRAKSKLPIMEALLAAVAYKQGAEMLMFSSERIVINVFHMAMFVAAIDSHTTKNNPTRDDSARRKTLVRWFTGLPDTCDFRRSEHTPFHITATNKRRHACAIDAASKLFQLAKECRFVFANQSKEE